MQFGALGVDGFNLLAIVPNLNKFWVNPVVTDFYSFTYELRSGVKFYAMKGETAIFSNNTIPAKYYDSLGLSSEVDCIYANNMLIFFLKTGGLCLC